MRKTVPLTIRNVFQGFAETEGILSVDGTDLRLEFQTNDALVGLLRSSVREVRLPLDEVEEIAFRKRWFGCSLVVRVAELRGASGIPNFKQGEFVLSIARKHSQAAADLVSSLQIAEATQKRVRLKLPVSFCRSSNGPTGC